MRCGTLGILLASIAYKIDGGLHHKLTKRAFESWCLRRYALLDLDSAAFRKPGVPFYATSGSRGCSSFLAALPQKHLSSRCHALSPARQTQPMHLIKFFQRQANSGPTRDFAEGAPGAVKSRKPRDAARKAKTNSEEDAAWSLEMIDKRVYIQNTSTKGRCLFINDDCHLGEVILVEKPILVTEPSVAPKLWEALTNLKEKQLLDSHPCPYFSALVSLFYLDQMAIHRILDKFVPDKDEHPGDDVRCILDQLSQVLKIYQKTAINPRTFQRLVSAWRFNAFARKDGEPGSIMYDRISMCAHSCEPSCTHTMTEDNSLVLRACRNLSKNDELTISYLATEDLGHDARRLKLQSKWLFTCTCARCTPVLRGLLLPPPRNLG
eukprot:gnl/MRDRNA2_/MRDRNA2_218955_c0_seq1.p1 gnl/MRDRNA2_/MRDRNA2_218955_c0~~gnl/MRDRNA2_/MRDRNA2_218955_c0_seq1.p1  ORF type:complete len:379 (+),score=52.90 gnl/MRDRNA2_/MRDRNA2_218955_c0_seq1:75-1211(+)